MANLFTDDTGLPFAVWISPKGRARQDIRVEVAPNNKARRSEMASVAIRPTIEVVAGHVSTEHMVLLRQWIALNKDIIIQYWDGIIDSNIKLAAAIKPIKP